MANSNNIRGGIGRTLEEVSRHDFSAETGRRRACSLLWLAWLMRGSNEAAGIIDDQRSSISWMDVVIIVCAGVCASCSCVRFLCAFSLVLTSCGRFVACSLHASLHTYLHYFHRVLRNGYLYDL